MADYTTITNAQVDPEAPITSELMSALRDNPIAIAEGASGAPQVANAALAGHPFKRADLSTGTSSASGSLGDTGEIQISLSPYSFFPSVSGGSASVRFEMVASVSNGGADGPRFNLRNATGSFGTYAVSWRFINA